jgi:hypothetical protein
MRLLYSLLFCLRMTIMHYISGQREYAYIPKFALAGLHPRFLRLLHAAWPRGQEEPLKPCFLGSSDSTTAVLYVVAIVNINHRFHQTSPAPLSISYNMNSSMCPEKILIHLIRRPSILCLSNRLKAQVWFW